ncbi:MAG: hypothetical protein ACJ76D_07525 [Solirubrobacterales bacterium]
MKGGTKVVLALMVALCAIPANAFAAAPSNDDFANAQELSGLLPILQSGSNIEAGTEPGETVSGLEAGHSVWFEWEATSSGWFTVGVCDSDFAAIAGVFTGTEVGNLTRVVNGMAAEGPDCRNQRQYTFHASGPTNYVIRVDGQSIPTPEGPPPPVIGSFTLAIEKTPPPPNDNFANATILAAPVTEEPGGDRFYGLFTQGYNWNATTEPDEFTFGAGPASSVWYRWTAPQTGTYRLTGPCCGSGLNWALFVGGSFGIEHEMLAANGSAEASLVGGTEYWIDVYGQLESGMTEPRMGAFDLLISATLPRKDTETPNPFEPTPRGPDTTAPQTTIDHSTLRAATRTAKFWFSASEPAQGFLCQLDKGDFKPCGSPRSYRRLKPGGHTVRVAAVDIAGNADRTPAVARFKIPKSHRHRR